MRSNMIRYDQNLGDTVDPSTEAYASEQRAIEREKTARFEWNALTPEQQAAQIQAKKDFDRMINLKNSHSLMLNNGPVATLPLNNVEETFRKIIVAGDWNAASRFTYISPFRFPANVSLGKYRFAIVNGRKNYIPWTRADFENYIETFSSPNKFGFSLLVEPGRDFNECDWNHIIDRHMAAQAKQILRYPITDHRHVWPIYPSQYLCQVYKASTWVKIRKPVAIAVGVVAAIYLGPIVFDKISGTLVGGTTEGAKASTILSKVQSGVQVYNKAQTVNAIIHGEFPPPPIGISGATFTEWAMDIAKKEIVSEAKSYAAEKGMDYVAQKLTEKEEAKLRAEIEAMQRDLAKLIPPGTVIEPDPTLQPDVRAKILELQDIEQKDADNNLLLLAVAIPAALMLAG